jgi:carbon monoxide dehydrogenase subunit G
MQIAGQISMDVPRQRAISACHDPENLKILLPVTGTITKVDETQFDILLTPNTPFFKSTLPGTLTLTPIEEGFIYQLEASAKVPLVGGIDMSATLNFDGGKTQCTVNYAGKIAATGMLARLLYPREARIRANLEARFEQLRLRIIQIQRGAERRSANIRAEKAREAK